MMRALVVLVAFASSAALAQTFPFAGVLETSDGRFDGLVDVELAILSDDNTPLWTETQPAVVVVDGVFAIDVGSAVALPASMPARARLALTIDDDALPAIPLARLIESTGVATANRVASAATANTLAGAAAADVATRAALAGPGGPAVDFSNISGVDDSVRDDDQGTVVSSTSADFLVSNRSLELNEISGARLGTATVSGSLLVAGRIQVASNAITGAKFADGTMTRIGLAEDVTAREVKTIPVFIQAHAACGSGFTTSGTCTPPSCGAGRQTECDGTGCSTPSPLPIRQCFNITKVGELVVEQ